jgi:hypothetical protein
MLTQLLANLRDAAIEPGPAIWTERSGGFRERASAVLADLFGLPAGAAALARAAAVVSNGVDARRAARLAGVSADQVDPLVDTLAAARIIGPHRC